MRVIRTIHEIRRILKSVRAKGQTVGFVPTMGALHAGHMSLIDAARETCDVVVVSIFVNPTQFGPKEDLDAYPRPIDADLAACEDHGVAIAFVPSEREMYPDGRSGGLTKITVARLPDTLCGRTRPGHFDGVCTVVAKLFHIVQPDRAFFGLKDYQQLAIIRRMTDDLDLPVEIVPCPIIREADGLARSSRNAYLTVGQRAQAPALYAALCNAADRVRQSHPSVETVIAGIRRHLAQQAPDGVVDYIQLVDPATLKDVFDTNQPLLIALAVQLGKARLIDNLLVE